MMSPGRLPQDTTRRFFSPRLCCLRLGVVAACLLATAAAGADTELLSRASYPAGATQPGMAELGGPRTFAASGSVYVFASSSTAVAPGLLDLNGSLDVFVRDSNSLGASPILVSHTAGKLWQTARGSSSQPKISANGRWVLFTSSATDLVSPPTTGVQVFRYDLQTRTIRLISHQVGAPQVGVSSTALGLDISEDGRFVAFSTPANAADLVAGVTDLNTAEDLFLWDENTDTHQLVTRDPADPGLTVNHPNPLRGQAAKLLVTGKVAFSGVRLLSTGGSPSFFDLYLFDPVAGTNSLISHSSSSSTQPASGNLPELCRGGHSSGHLLFTSNGTNLVSGVVDNNGAYDLFLYDVLSGNNELISRDPLMPTFAVNGESSCGVVSSDGRWVHFASLASNLSTNTHPGISPDVFRHDRQSGTNTLISVNVGVAGEATGGVQSPLELAAADGSVLLFGGSSTSLVSGGLANSGPWSFRWESGSGQVESAVVVPGNANVASTEALAFRPDGGASLFSTNFPTELTGAPHVAVDAEQLLVYRDGTSGPALVQPAAFAGSGSGSLSSFFTSSGSSSYPTALISENGETVAFVAASSEICGSDNPLCVLDRVSGTMHNAKHLWNDPETFFTEETYPLELSQDGRWLLLQSFSPLLAPVEQNQGADLFLYDIETKGFELISHANGQPTTTADRRTDQFRDGRAGMMTADARFITFQSDATNLLPTVSSNTNVYLRDRQAQTLRLVSHVVGNSQVGGNGTSNFPVLAANGSAVVFQSAATDIFPGFVSNNGQFADVFLYDVATEVVHLVTRSGGNPVFGVNGVPFGYLKVSADGRFVAHANSGNIFISLGTDDNLSPDIFRYDRASNTNTLISHASGAPLVASDGTQTTLFDMSSDGRFVLFSSNASNLIPGVSGHRLYLWDGQDDSLRVIPHRLGAPSFPGILVFASLSADGRRVFFSTPENEVVPGIVDTNAERDYFLWERQTGRTQLITSRFGESGRTGNGGCFADGGGRLASASGERLLLWCKAPDLTRYDNNPGEDLFLISLPTPLFADGFESGTTAAWSQVVP